MVGAVFIDFSETFDMVDHTIVKNKLTWMGIKGKTEAWVSEYLLNWKHRNLANGVTSGEEYLHYRGSGLCWAPFLFLIYINALSKWLETEHLFLYTDDTVV